MRGGASAFAKWCRYLPPAIDLLPGREECSDEPAYRDMVSLTAALAETMAPHLDRLFAVAGSYVWIQNLPADQAPAPCVKLM